MGTQSSTAWGVLAGLMLGLSAQAVHWFLTPHPEASTLWTGLVVMQLVVAAALGVWAWRKGRGLERSFGVGNGGS